MIELLPGGRDAVQDGDVLPRDDIPELEPDLGEDDLANPYESLERWQAHLDALNALEEVRQSPGPFVELGSRAIALIEALKHFAHSNQLRGFNKTSKPNDVSVVAAACADARGRADEALKRAYGYQEMIMAGVNPLDVADDFVNTRFNFVQTYLKTGDPAVAARRRAYRKRLSPYRQ